MYRESFRYKGRILEVGTPRLDALFDDKKNVNDELRSKLNISKESKVVLFAPTFRGVRIAVSTESGAYLFDFETLREQLKKKYECDVVILLRFHPCIASASRNINMSQGVINVSEYSDVYDLLMITDILITDYSSLMFEASYIKRPVYLYATDVEEYIHARGHYFDYYKLPYPIATNVDELINNMTTLNYSEIEDRIDTFFEEELELKETGAASCLVASEIDKMIRKGFVEVETMV